MKGNSQTIFDVFGDETSIKILILGSDGPVSVDEIADACGIVPSTVYRKATRLVESGMLAEENAISESGDHYKQFRTTVERITFTIRDGELTVSLDSEWTMSDRSDAFWADLNESLSTSTEFTIGLPERRAEDSSE